MHRFRTAAANSFLKLLEEPPEKVQIILTTSKPNMLLSTIVSRCQKIKFDPLTWQEIESALIERKNINPEKANLFSRMSFGSYRHALELLDENIDEKQELLLDILRKIIRTDLDLVLLVENLTSQEDLKTIKDLLALMLIWFRDALVIESVQDEEKFKDKIINIEHLDILQKFINSFESIDYEKILAKIENALELIEKNVYLNLILLQLLFELKRLLRRKKHV